MKSKQLHCFLKIRVSETELAAFQAAAQIAGLTVSQWVRTALRERVPHRFTADVPKPPFEGKGIKP